MADNTTLNTGSGGDTIASDDIAGIKHQRVKLSVGADGSASDAVPVSAGLDTTGAAVQAVGIVAQYDDSTPSAVTEDQFAPVRMSSRRALLVEGVASGTVIPVSDGGGALTVDNGGTFAVQVDAALPAGTNAIGTLAANSGVDIGDVDVTSVVPGTGATNLGKAEDAAHTTGDVGVMALSVRQDTAAALGGTDADYQPLITDASGRLHVNVGNTVTVTGTGGTFPVTDSGGALTVDWNGTAPPIGAGVEATALRVTLATDSTGVVSVDDNGGAITVDNGGTFVVQAGTAAHDAAISGNPVRVAGRALSSDYTAVTAGDTADIITTLTGKVVTAPHALPGQTWSYAAASGGITNTTGVTAKAAGAAGVRNYITRCQVINGHATVSTDVQIRDGASGTVLWRGFAQAAGGGVTAVFDPPLRGTAATLVEVACGTTGSATYFNLQGYTAAE